jgi:hypothetical protein
LVMDFFSHIDRVREFCKMNDIHFRKPPNAACAEQAQRASTGNAVRPL